MQFFTSSLVLVLSFAGVASAQSGAQEDSQAHAAVKGTVIAAATDVPIATATVQIRRGATVVATSTTDAEGRFRVSLPPGTYEVTFKQGSSKLTRQFEARAGKVAVVNGRIRQTEGEVIVIREKRKARRARAKNFNRLRTPPYSNKAIVGNHWAKAWLLLDVDETGEVTRVKFINRPGHDLDDIAVGEAMKLEFSPSLNEDGEPIKTLVVWSIEWPAYWWLVDRTGSSSSIPPLNNPHWGTAGPAAPVGATPLRSSGPRAEAGKTVRGGFGTGFRQLTGEAGMATQPLASMADSVPCEGTEPLNLDSVSPVQKDCSLPDFDKPFDSEPWIERTGAARK